ncbi:MAG: hypothetical protein LC664_10815 [Flavobacteriales bacterium]|nr:hypothetical protein [Flavobacteriales bacterium]
MKEILKIYFLLLLVTALAVSCQDDDENTCCDPTNPECPNYDPCWDKEEPNASFFTEDRLTWPEFGENLWIHDTILKGGLIRFRSPFEGEGISHKWYVGTEILEEPSITRNFTNVQRPTTITVSHVITYPVDTICYPFASGRDSIVQNFHLIDSISELLTIENTFRGVLNNQTDSFDFKCRALRHFWGTPARWNSAGWGFYLINFHNNQDSVRNDGIDFTNTRLTFTDLSNPKGVLVVDPIDFSVEMTYPIDFSVEMTYQFPDDNTEYTFRGRVIPE